MQDEDEHHVDLGDDMPVHLPSEVVQFPAPWMKADFLPTTEALTSIWLAEMRMSGGPDFRYVGGRWWAYHNGIWMLDERETAARSIGAFQRKVGGDMRKPRVRTTVESWQTHTGMTGRARHELAALADEFDCNRDLVAVPSGVIHSHDEDYDTPRPHAKDYLITRCCAVEPADMATPIWDAFMLRVCAGDSEVIAYLYRWFGYCLTGNTSEQVFVFMYGFGQNGKGVMLDTIQGIMGSYAFSASIELFVKQRFEKPTEELAAMRGVRLVVAEELDEGRPWNEGLLKHLVSGDRVRARYMRQNSFEYTPHFKITVTGNSRPVISHVDKAMRRRIHLVPFVVEIPDQDRDKQLKERLKEEWPGILWKLLQGQAAWRKNGLNPPEAVLTATEEYVEDEDSIAQWIRECCTLADINVRTVIQVLYGSWHVWAQNAGEPRMSMKAFSQALRAHKLRPFRISTARGFEGIKLVPISNPTMF